MTYLYTLVDGRPAPEPSSPAWALWFRDADRGVAETAVGEARVSTVFLGIDHGLGGPPLLYETMVFGGPSDGEQQRYGTLEEARAGHEAMVARVMDAPAGDPVA